MCEHAAQGIAHDRYGSIQCSPQRPVACLRDWRAAVFRVWNGERDVQLCIGVEALRLGHIEACTM